MVPLKYNVCEAISIPFIMSNRKGSIKYMYTQFITHLILPFVLDGLNVEAKGGRDSVNVFS